MTAPVRPSERDIRIAAALIAAVGLGASGVAILAGELGVGTRPEMFGWKRVSLLVAGGGLVALGALLLARPRIASRLAASSQRIAAGAPLSAASRRWLVVGVLIALLGLASGLALVRLGDRLIVGQGGNDAPPPEVGAAPPAKPTPQDRFRAAVSATCERHQMRVHRMTKRGYASPTSARPRLLRANAAALSAVRAELRRLAPPPEDAAAHSRFLGALRRLAAAYRAAAAASDDGDEAREQSQIEHARAVAEEGNHVAATDLGVPACGYG